jgi:hypothetical protein
LPACKTYVSLRLIDDGGMSVNSAVLQRLRHGYDPRPFFDQRATVTYSLLGSVLVGGAAISAVRGLRFDPALAYMPAWIAVAIAGGWAARRAGASRVATGLEATGIVYGQGLAALFLIYGILTFNFPLQDEHLAAADSAIGFHWPAIAEPLHGNPQFTEWAKFVYKAFVWEPAIVTLGLSATGKTNRLWTFVTAASFSLCVTALVGAMLPAYGSIVYFKTGSWPELVSAWRQSEVIHALRSGQRYIDRSMITGVISIPSYHACSAVLMTWALWPSRHLRWGVAVLNLGMATAAIVIGEHYLVDIFAGLAVATLAILLARRVISRSGEPVCA